MKNTLNLALAFCLLITAMACNKANDNNDNNNDGPVDGPYVITGYIAGFCNVPCSYFYKAQNNTLKRSGAVRNYPDTLHYNGAGTATEYALLQSLQLAIPDTLYTMNNGIFGCPNCHDQGGYYLTVKKNNQLYKWMIDPDIIDSSNHFLHSFALQMRNTFAQLPN